MKNFTSLAFALCLLWPSPSSSAERFVGPWVVFPNPFTTSVSIDVPRYPASSGLEFLIYDASGAYVDRVTLLPGRNTLELPRLQTGVYFYRTRGGPFIFTGKFIKVK
jgi:hypothetical protein